MMYLTFHPKPVFVLVPAQGIIAFASIRRFFIRRRFVRAHGCQKIASSLNKEPFFGLDAILGTMRPFPCLRQHICNKRAARHAIVTVEPENIKTVLSLKFNDYGINHCLEPFKPLLGEGIFDTDGDHWASSRALIRPSFTRDQIADLMSLENLIQDLFSLLPRYGKTVMD